MRRFIAAMIVRAATHAFPVDAQVAETIEAAGPFLAVRPIA